MYGGSGNNQQEDDLYTGYDNQENDFNAPSIEDELQAQSMGTFAKPVLPANGRLGTAMNAVTATRGGEDGARPLTSVRAAGYSSQVRGKLDPLKAVAGQVAFTSVLKKPEQTFEQQCRNDEREVHKALEESAAMSAKGDYSLALERAKEAAKLERNLSKKREEQSSGDQINMDLTFSVCLNLGQEYHNNKLYSDALNVYSSLAKNKQFSHSGTVRLKMGNTYFEQGKFPNAIKMYRMSLDQIPTTSKFMKFKILRNIGLSFIRMGQYQDAVQALDSVVESIPDPVAAFNLLICMHALGDYERIQTAFLKLLGIKGKMDFQEEEEGEDGGIEIALADDGLKKEFRRRKNELHKYILTAARLIAPKVVPGKEIEGYDWVVSHLTSHGFMELASQMDMAKALEFLSQKDFKSAVSCLKGFEKKQEELKASAATNLSFLYFLESDVKNAEKYGKMATDVDRYNALALVNSGNCSFVREDFEEARNMYAEAVNVEADCLEAMYNLGLANKSLGNIQEAYDVFKKVNSMIPESTDVMYQIGDILYIMGRHEEAVKWFEALNTAVPNDPGVLIALGSLHCTLGDEAKALHFYLESHRIYPASMNVISWIGAFYAKSEMYEKAVPYFELATNIKPLEVKWKLMVASCYRRIGAFPLALRKYKEIHKESPDNVECLRYLVHLCNELGSREEVMGYAKKLKKLEKEGGAKASQHQDSVAAHSSPPRQSPLAYNRNPEAFMGDHHQQRPSTSQGRSGGNTPSKLAPQDDDDWGNEELGDDLLPM
ncbi:intraflagellar transport particle protein 88 [Chloropicon primus]|uniref:Intraflagellar transport particle protein 88 n=1 Tax=Chloropicon primus TaxID=1764295 RepID=A0A5B8MBI0_9CHLO|nr:intraflagellar transport particle protein 88 [Chloropicon primus]UPQ97013.1 intraflagellar transport particle protein 88 [Chloropicon primus]|eukprot:QDZ17796.1 intraflagellar transport particle protein 88 [Chloropicon primus]